MEVQWPLLVFSVFLGITSGIFIFLGIGEVKAKFKEIRFLGSLIALILLAVGGCVSVLHMGHPERAMNLLGNLGSGLSKELFVTGLMGIVAFIYVLLARKDYPSASKLFGIIGAVIGIVLPVIAGSSYMVAARPAWDSFTVPLMFLGTGIGLGFALMALLVFFKGDTEKDGTFALRLALIGFVIAAVTVLAYVVWIAMAPYQAASRSIMRLVAGDLSVLFWLFVVIVGFAAPIILTVLARKSQGKNASGDGLPNPKDIVRYLSIAFACSVIGSVVIRVIMYAVGTSVDQMIYK